MQLHVWRKILRRKPLAPLVLLVVLALAVATVLRLTASSSGDGDVSSSTRLERSTSPVELHWPLPLSKQEAASSRKPTFSPRSAKKLAPVGAEELKKLKDVFPKIDINDNGYVSVDELRNWIISKVKEHLQGALRENIFLFTSIDKDPRNGQVSWDEYHAWFFKKNGINTTESEKDKNDNHAELDRSLREKIAWDQASWSEAAKTDPKVLNLDEFLAFRHPESSHTNLLNKADEILGEYDRDADDTLTWEEYSSISEDSVLVKRTVQRREEFDNYIDRNRDGKIDKREILSYMDPRNPRHSHLEAEALIKLSDKNADMQLGLDEILLMAEAFLSSKVIDTESKFHDEF